MKKSTQTTQRRKLAAEKSIALKEEKQETVKVVKSKSKKENIVKEAPVEVIVIKEEQQEMKNVKVVKSKSKKENAVKEVPVEVIENVEPNTPKKSVTPFNPDLSTSKKKEISKSRGIFGREVEDSLTPRVLFNVRPSVKKVYKLIQKSTGALGGNGYDGAIYGELTMQSMQKVINFLIDNCEMTNQSRFIDVGSGLGKPNFHAAQDPGVRVSLGIELEDIRWQLSMQNLDKIVPEMTDNHHDLTLSQSGEDGSSSTSDSNVKLSHGVNFIQGDIFNVSTMDPFTHIYMYDLGFPPPLQQKIAENFNNSTHSEYLISYRPPRRVINEYGYQVTSIGQLPTSMTGSGEIHTCYFYKRSNTPAPCKARPNTTLISIPPRVGSNDPENLTVVCADAFTESILLAVGNLDNFKTYVRSVANKMISSGRPVRERKPRVLDF